MNTSIQGTIISITGQLAIVQFRGQKPRMHDVLIVDDLTDVTLHVYTSAGSAEQFYCLIMGDSGLLMKGMKVVSTGNDMQFPVGAAMLGRVVDAFGNPADGNGPIESKTGWPIHGKNLRDPEGFSKNTVLETGIKVIDFFAPIVRGGKVGLFGGAGVGKSILLSEIM